MISLLPASSPAETNAAYTLLGVIADPKAAKQRLDELVAERTKLEASLKDLQVATAKHEANKEEMYAKIGAADVDLRKRSDSVNAATAKSVADHKVRQTQLSDHEAVLAATQKRLEGVDADVTKRESDVSKREASLQLSRDEVSASAVAARKLHQEATALKAAYEGKEAALQAALYAAPKHYTIQAETGQLGTVMGEAK